jgi:hypothetical protein
VLPRPHRGRPSLALLPIVLAALQTGRPVLYRLTSTLISRASSLEAIYAAPESGESGPHGQRKTEALTPRILVQWLFDAILGGRSLGLGIVDCRFGQLGGPISGCDCV